MAQEQTLLKLQQIAQNAYKQAEANGVDKLSLLETAILLAVPDAIHNPQIRDQINKNLLKQYKAHPPKGSKVPQLQIQTGPTAITQLANMILLFREKKLNIPQAFEQLSNGSPSISAPDLLSGLTSFGMDLRKEQADELFELMDERNVGSITQDDFKHAIITHKDQALPESKPAIARPGKSQTARESTGISTPRATRKPLPPRAEPGMTTPRATRPPARPKEEEKKGRPSTARAKEEVKPLQRSSTAKGTLTRGQTRTLTAGKKPPTAAGVLTVRITNGKNLGPGTKKLAVSLGSDKFFTDEVSSTDPKLNFDSEFHTNSTTPKNVTVELLVGRNVQASGVMEWDKARTMPIKGKVDLLNKGKSVVGVLFFSMKWSEGLPKVQLLRSGYLGIKITAVMEIPDMRVAFYIENAGASFQSTQHLPLMLTIGPIKYKSLNSDLKFALEKPGTLQEVASATTTVADLIGDSNWGDVYSLYFTNTSLVDAQFKWTDLTPREIEENIAAIKIQARWRGKRTRDIYANNQTSLIGRTGYMTNGRYYLLSVINHGKDKYLVQLHPVDQDAEMYEVLSSIVIDKTPTEVIWRDITVQPNQLLTFNEDITEIEGNLIFEFSDIGIVQGSIREIQGVSEGARLEFPNLKLSQVPQDLEATFITSDGSEIQWPIYWLTALTQPFTPVPLISLVRNLGPLRYSVTWIPQNGIISRKYTSSELQHYSIEASINNNTLTVKLHDLERKELDSIQVDSYSKFDSIGVKGTKLIVNQRTQILN